MWSNRSMVETGIDGMAGETRVGEVEFEPLGELADGSRFRLPLFEAGCNPAQDDCVVVGWTYGVRLRATGEQTVLVQLDGDQTHVVFGTDGRRREFDGHGITRTSYPAEIDVCMVDTQAEEAQQRIHELAAREERQEMANEKALKAKYVFQTKALADATEAGDLAKAELAQGRIDAVIAEAEAAGINLVTAATADSEPRAQAASADKPSTPAPGTTTAAEKAQTEGSKLKEANAIRKADLAAKKAMADKAKADAKAEKEAAKSEKQKQKEADRAARMANATRDCICGCGAETSGLFKAGHDARVKGILLNVERGTFPGGFAALAETLKPYVVFDGDAETAGKDDSTYRLIQAPVKFPGREEIAVVKDVPKAA